MAAVVGATGFAQVATIRGQQPPAQFGGARQQGTPFLVGERGPELFTPATAGTVTPNHQLGKGSTVVNFNINTVSAKGFNELLQGSRGMIVNMINTAVNERGRANLV
jgi:phage-related minor tail protein